MFCFLSFLFIYLFILLYPPLLSVSRFCVVLHRKQPEAGQYARSQGRQHQRTRMSPVFFCFSGSPSFFVLLFLLRCLRARTTTGGRRCTRRRRAGTGAWSTFCCPTTPTCWPSTPTATCPSTLPRATRSSTSCRRS